MAALCHLSYTAQKTPISRWRSHISLSCAEASMSFSPDIIFLIALLLLPLFPVFFVFQSTVPVSITIGRPQFHLELRNLYIKHWPSLAYSSCSRLFQYCFYSIFIQTQWPQFYHRLAYVCSHYLPTISPVTIARSSNPFTYFIAPSTQSWQKNRPSLLMVFNLNDTVCVHSHLIWSSSYEVWCHHVSGSCFAFMGNAATPQFFTILQSWTVLSIIWLPIFTINKASLPLLESRDGFDHHLVAALPRVRALA